MIHINEPISNTKVYQTAIATYGEVHQLDKCIEECAELIQAIQKYKDNPDCNNKNHLLLEMADVYTTLEQVKIIAGFENIAVFKMIDSATRKLAGYLNIVE